MKQSVSLTTLGVSDYERTKSFYATLGWSPTLEIEETAFYHTNGVVLVLWSREKLAADTGIADDGCGGGGGAFTVLHKVASRQEVDDVRDPDGHAGQIAHNPAFGLAADGRVLLGERA
jgi:catechol 2,3-dioxygenase-like lactoylglutathione lyase family enzyme